MSKIKLQGNASGTGTTTVQSANTSSNTTFTLPGTDGSANQFLQTDGSGNLTFATGLTSGGALGTPSSGTLTNCTGLPVSGVSGLGSNVATFLATPSSANLAAALTDETGTGANVFANTPTLVTPILGTPTSGNLSNCTVDGTNPVGFRNVPISSNSTNTLVVGDVGKVLSVTAGQTVPDSTFAAGDVVVIFNNSSSSITLTMSITTAYIAGTDSDKATMTLATRGVATILFISGTVCVVSGNVS
jgi:hypothetical protein